MGISHYAQRVDLDLSPILERFGTWAVTTYGLECLTHYCPIEKDRLDEPDWEKHMGNKRWINYGDFQQALYAAQEYHGRSRIPKKDRAKTVDLKQRARILKRDGSICQMCGAGIEDGVKLHVDHRVPRAKGGTSDDDNLWTLCHMCNGGKSDL